MENNCALASKVFMIVSKILVIIGALNWGLAGGFNYNLVEVLLGTWPGIMKIVYILVGLAGVKELVDLVKSYK